MGSAFTQTSFLSFLASSLPELRFPLRSVAVHFFRNSRSFARTNPIHSLFTPSSLLGSPYYASYFPVHHQNSYPSLSSPLSQGARHTYQAIHGSIDCCLPNSSNVACPTVMELQMERLILDRQSQKLLLAMQRREERHSLSRRKTTLVSYSNIALSARSADMKGVCD